MASWGIDSYLASALEAWRWRGTIAGSGSVHIFGDCSGGMFLCMLLAHQAVTGRQTIRTGTMGVTVVDFGEPGGLGITASDHGLKNIRRRAERGEIISAESICQHVRLDAAERSDLALPRRRMAHGQEARRHSTSCSGTPTARVSPPNWRWR